MLIRSVRRAQGLSQDQLAQRLDVSRAWIVQIEQGKPSVRLDLVLRVLNELEISLSASNDIGDEKPVSSIPDDCEIIDIDAIADMGLQHRQVPPSKSGPKRRR
jgi:HTH-type transcriptional regulator/antitoxin HipB